MGKKQITETVSVKINWTEKEKMQVILQGSIITMTKLYHRFNDAMRLYEKDGYTIRNQDQDKLTFIAEKEYEIESEDE